MAEVQGRTLEPFTHGIYSLNVLTGLWIMLVHWLSLAFFFSWWKLTYQNSLEHHSAGILTHFSEYSCEKPTEIASFSLSVLLFISMLSVRPAVTWEIVLGLNYRFVLIALTRISHRVRDDVGFSLCTLYMWSPITMDGYVHILCWVYIKRHP